MFRTSISNNGIIVINRGDTFYAPLFINISEDEYPEQHILVGEEAVYFAICEPNQEFESGVVRKIFTKDDLTEDGDVNIKLEPSDTEHLLPGTYYYEIKVKIIDPDTSEEIIDTIVPRRKLVIC